MLYEALLVQHKCGHTQLYLAYEYVQNKSMQDIREIEFRDSGSNTNTKICFEVRAIALHPCLHTEGFPLRPHKISYKGNLHRGICNYKLGVYNSSLQHNHLYSRDKALFGGGKIKDRGVNSLFDCKESYSGSIILLQERRDIQTRISICLVLGS